MTSVSDHLEIVLWFTSSRGNNAVKQRLSDYMLDFTAEVMSFDEILSVGEALLLTSEVYMRDRDWTRGDFTDVSAWQARLEGLIKEDRAKIIAMIRA